MPLKVEGNRLTGSGQSLEGKQAVSVDLTRRVAGGNFDFEGDGRQRQRYRKDSMDRQQRDVGGRDRRAIPRGTRDRGLATELLRHLAASAARAGRPCRARGLLDTLRDQNVRVAYSGLMPSCRVLRSELAPFRSTSKPSASARSSPIEDRAGRDPRLRIFLQHAQHGARGAELVRSAQIELRRIGCFSGRDDGRSPAPPARRSSAISRCAGNASGDIKVTKSFVAALRDQDGRRVCPLTCARGQHAEGDRCVADAKPEPEKKKPTAKPSASAKSRAARRGRSRSASPSVSARPRDRSSNSSSRPARRPPCRPCRAPAAAPSSASASDRAGDDVHDPGTR